MISEGWDYPELGILVMARPTLSKVLYLQQIGRRLRKTDVKKNVFVVDVVDEYGAKQIRSRDIHSAKTERRSGQTRGILFRSIWSFSR